MSGEYTTSIENSLVNWWILQTLFPNASIVVNGDDSLVFLDRHEFDKIDMKTILSEFSKFGQETKLDRISTVIEEIDFCQCSPVLIDGRYRLIRKPWRVLGRTQLSSYDLTSKNIDKYLAGIGICEMTQNCGAPILQQFCLKIIELASFRGLS